MTRSSREQVSAVVDSVLSGWQWLTEGLGFFAPEGWRTKRWRQESEIFRPAGEEFVHVGMIERSFFGARCLVPDLMRSSNAACIVLGDASFFRTHIVLPATTADRISEAVALRVPEISPAPPEEVVAAWEFAGRSPDGRIVVDVAIARRREVDRLADATPHRSVRIAGLLADSHQPQFVFKRVSRARAWRDYRPLLPWAYAIAGLLFFVLGAPALVQREIATIQSRIIQTAAALKYQKQESVRLQMALAASKQATSLPTPQEVAHTLVDTSNRLPSGVVFAEASVTGRTLHIVGFAPQNALAQAKIPDASIQVVATRRPGFDSVTIDRQIEAVP